MIPILQAIQSEYRYLPNEALERVCELTDIQPASIEGVATFYSQFRREPVGQHVISLCDGTACHVKGSEDVHEAMAERLNLKKGEDTDADGKYTIQKVACIGCCSLEPAMQIDGVTYANVAPESGLGGALQEDGRAPLDAQRRRRVRQRHGRELLRQPGVRAD